jgi:uncharacterized protein
LIDENWAQFLSKFQFQVGVSLDGPKRLHDCFRKFHNGQESFEDVMRGVELLRKYNLNPGVLSVIHSQNVKHPKEMFNFFVNTGFRRIVFNHIKIGGRPYSKKLPRNIVEPKEYTRFINKVFDLWLLKDDSRIEIRQIRSILQGLLGGQYRSCEFDEKCDRFFTVEYNGEIYPCDCDYGLLQKKFHFGNIKNGIEKIITSDKYKKYQIKLQKIKQKCSKCRWYRICKGGCLGDYSDITLNNFKNYFCQGLKKIYQHIWHKLRSYGISSYEF